MSRSRIQNERIRLANELENALKRKLTRLQQRVYSAALGMVDLQTTQDDRLSFNVRNIQKANRIAVSIQQNTSREVKNLFQWLVNQLLKLFRLNDRYFKSFNKLNQDRTASILYKVMLRYGYNTKTRRIESTGILAGLAQVSPIANQIGELISNSLAARTPLKEFKNRFRSVFLNPGGLGLIEAQFNRFTNDLFQDFDRQTQKQFAEDLKLTYAIYSGTIMKRTRDFCDARTNNIYTSEEIAKWNNQNWKGKRKGVPVEVQLGGYNCRHHLSYISEELALKLAKSRGGINNYN